MGHVRAAKSAKAIVTLCAVCFLPATGLGDRGEYYSVLSVGPSLGFYDGPIVDSGSGSGLGGSGEFAVYYGLTNSLHVGGVLHLTYAKDIAIRDATMVLSDGSRSVGTVYFNDLAIGVGGVVLYRVDTGYAIAPVFSCEIGINRHGYSQIEQTVNGTTYSLAFPDMTEVGFGLRASALLEYRLGDRWLLAAGVAIGAELNGSAPLQVSVPLRVGVIW